MDERHELLKSIAGTISDYRIGEFETPTVSHVNHWVCQFDDHVQVPILRELAHVLGKTYFSKQKITTLISAIVSSEKFGIDNSEFWRNANFICFQQRGESQKYMLKFFDADIYKKFGFHIKSCGSQGGPFVYMDDVIFSGRRVGNDLCDWMSSNHAPVQAVVYILVLVTHTLGKWQLEERLKKHANEVKKDISFRVFDFASLENRKKYANNSEVLWPVALPKNDKLQDYINRQERFPFIARETGGELKINLFSSERGRQLLEREFLLAGIKIISACKEPKKIMRPLGFGEFGLGFGATIVTYRNCPNNCPLALWWGDPHAPDNHPLSKWYPLMPRKTYDQH